MDKRMGGGGGGGGGGGWVCTAVFEAANATSMQHRLTFVVPLLNAQRRSEFE